MIKYTIENCRKFADKKNGKCLSDKYIPKNRLIWQCKFGHTWTALFEWVYHGNTWCGACSKTKKRSIKDCQNLAQLKNGKCLSIVYINSKSPLLWECEKAHQWITKYNTIQRGHWCPECKKCKKKTIEDCKNLALLKNGKCLSETYKNSFSYLLWECNEGHQWKAVSNNIQQGQWCLKCKLKNSKNTIEECQQLALLKNGKCLSTIYIDNVYKMIWSCQDGHVWETSLHSIKNGAWCHECRYGKSQKQLFEIIKKIYVGLPIVYNCIDFQWLRKKHKKSKKMEIDIYLPTIKLAIEYDGVQHFKSIKFFGGRKTLIKIQRNDKIKNRLISEHSNDIKIFIRIPYWEPITEENVKRILQQNNIL